MLVSIVMRGLLDVYKFCTIIAILFVWMLHWLAIKRYKGLIGEESRSVLNHARLLALFAMLILFDGTVSYIFMLQFMRYGVKMDFFSALAGFEVSFPKF
jgi:hypothetical protein